MSSRLDRSVGMGEMRVVRSPEHLEIRGLGSCIAVALHDPLQRLGGLAHVVIPRRLPNVPPAPAWAATDAVPALLAAMEAEGARATRIVARIAGGASMFPGPSKGFEVGVENANVVETLLRERGIPLLSRQVGGHASRSVRLDAENGRLDVRALDRQASRLRRATGQDPTEAARILLEAAAAPLSDLLQRPVAVEASGRHDLTAPEAVAFLGPGTSMRWSRLGYGGSAGPGEVHLVVPDLHARRVDDELRARLDEPPSEGSAVDEVLNIMATHVLTALARLWNATLRPEALETRRALTPQVVRALQLEPGASVRVAHARLHVEGAFHGADLALLGRDLP